MWKLIGLFVSFHQLVLFLRDVYRLPDPSVHPVAFSVDHLFSQPRHGLGPCQGDRQRKQQDGPMDEGSDTHREGTKQVDELR